MNDKARLRMLLRLLFAGGLIFSNFLSQSSVAQADKAPYRIENVSAPVFPFGENGFCSQNCPSLGLGAVVDFLSISILGQNPSSRPRASLNAGDTILILYIGLDNGGYSNWWDVKATLISDVNGSRAELGKGERDDGNDLKSIKVSCDRYFNKCNPNTTWSMIKIAPSFTAGSYSLELEFIPFSTSLPIVKHLLGPNVFTINSLATSGNSASPQGIGGRACKKLGGIRIVDGEQFACVKSGSKKIWRKIA